MMHTIKGNSKLIVRVRKIRGQLDALERALEGELECSDVLQQVSSAHGALNGLMVALVEDHIRCHVAEPTLTAKKRAAGAEELIGVVQTYLK